LVHVHRLIRNRADLFLDNEESIERQISRSCNVNLLVRDQATDMIQIHVTQSVRAQNQTNYVLAYFYYVKKRQRWEVRITEQWDAFVSYCYCWKAVNITYSECVFAALVVQHLTCMRRIINIDTDTFVNCNWVDTRWQQNSTHSHTNSTQNNTIK
jgi:hypothetical protein